MRQCMQLLRPDRWLTVVFQHWDVSYFRVILDAIAEEGGALKAAITHDKDVIWSMHNGGSERDEGDTFCAPELWLRNQTGKREFCLMTMRSTARTCPPILSWHMSISVHSNGMRVRVAVR